MNKKILIVDNGTRYLIRLKEMLVGYNCVVISYEDLNLEELSSFDLVILSGGYKDSVVGNEGKFSRELDFIRLTGEPVIGICLGLELIAYAYGAILKHMPKRQKSLLNIEVVKKDMIFGGNKNYLVFENHRWAVDKLPGDLIGLARSKDGFEIIKHKTKPIYGFQFHPEMAKKHSLEGELFLNAAKLLLNFSEQND